MIDSENFFLRKMKHERTGDVLQYTLGEIPMNQLVGSSIRLFHTGNKCCIACGRAIKKTFQQGYCFPCMRSLARCDSCIVRPERCHFHAGTCREPAWGEEHCLIEHVVYLANTTGLKVGITRAHKRFERWGDQGAFEALVFARVPERLIAGQLEVALKEFISDRTDWRGLIKGTREEVDLYGEKEALAESIPEGFTEYLSFDDEDNETVTYDYPVQSYPEKAVTWNLDKQNEVTGLLTGIRGQYLFIANKAINIRKYQGYEVQLHIP